MISSDPKLAVPRFFRVKAEAHGTVGRPELQAAYDRVHADYDAFWLAEAAGPIDDLVRRVRWSGAERVFVAGCGTGYATVQLAARSREVVAADLSAGMLERALERLREHGNVHVRLVAGDALAVLKDTGPFDVIFSSWVLGYIPLRPFLTSRAARSPREDVSPSSCTVRIPRGSRLVGMFAACEGPAGPKGDKGDDGDPGPKGDPGENLVNWEGFKEGIKCADCHNPDVDTLYNVWGIKTQWATSKHAAGGAYFENSTTCVSCHTMEGFVQQSLGRPLTDQATSSPIGCFACHSPHSRADFSLRTVEPVLMLAGVVGEPDQTFDYGKGNLCASCHKPRPLKHYKSKTRSKFIRSNYNYYTPLVSALWSSG